MESITKRWNSFKKSVKEFHTKKPHLEFFAALLTIPVLVTVLALNYNNLRGDDKKDPTPSPIIITQAPNTTEKVVTKAACEPGIGAISIVSPEEGEELSESPVTVDVEYDANGFCEVVWSYRINNGRWSDYDDRSIALYNLPNGNIKFDLRVKSVVNNDQESLSRNFVYSGTATSPTPNPTSTPTPAS